MAKEAEGVEFKLFAPYNEEVALLGGWNDWQPIPMTRGDDGWWRVRVPLQDGDYEYKFKLKSLSYFAEGKLLEVADPRTVCVSHDAYNNSLITVLNGQPVSTTYEWQHDDAPLPRNDDLILYELHVGDFSGGPGDDQHGPKGRFQDVIDKLDYLAELGITAVELMPVHECPGDYSWGYNPRYMYAIENSYGTPDDLCRLVDSCHARGIRVILDGVFNHSEGENPLTQIDYTYWYYRENPDPPNVQWGPKFNYDLHDEKLDVWPARQFARDMIFYWIDTFHIDGIRFDATAIINNFDLLHWFKNEIYGHLKGQKPFITIAEHVPQDPAVTGPDGPMDVAWHESFSKQIMCTMVMHPQEGRQPWNMDSIAHVIDARDDGYASPLNTVKYLDNHDQERIMWQLGKYGILDDPAFRRMEMGASLLMTAPGLPMLWMGQEFAESAPRTQEPQPIDWSLLQNDRNKHLHALYVGLGRLRCENPALREDTFEIIHQDSKRMLLAYKRWNDQGNEVVVVANLKDDYAGPVEIGGVTGGTYHEYTHNYDVDASDGTLRDKLAESEVKIYVKK